MAAETHHPQKPTRPKRPLHHHPEPAAAPSPPPMDAPAAASPHPASYASFNNALTAGLLNPMSPPPPHPLPDRSPTLLDMMASEPDFHPGPIIQNPPSTAAGNPPPAMLLQDRQVLLQERVEGMMGSFSPWHPFNDAASSDVKLALASKDGLSITLNLHRQFLAAHSRFFRTRLSDQFANKQQQGQSSTLPQMIEIAECDDVEAYMETLCLLYCRDIRRRLMKVDVSKVLAILKVSVEMGFDAGVLSCLEYLEAAPWAEEEEDKVASVLAQLHLEGPGAGEVLKRVSIQQPISDIDSNGEEIVMKLLQVVLEGKDEKARREMKGMVSKMLRESSTHSSVRTESLYSACNECLRLLRVHLVAAEEGAGAGDAGHISRQADNLLWVLDILIDRQAGEEFLTTWAAQAELAAAHGRVPVVQRYEVSRVTARLFVGVGKGQILVSKEARCELLRTWLGPFYEDFGWMKRACKGGGLDRRAVEEGLGNLVLTLPMGWQQEVLLGWFDRFLNSGEDCPNIQRAFEVWWRRAFWRRNGEPGRAGQLRILSAS